MLTRGDTLKAEGMIQPDDPDRVRKMQEEDMKIVQNNIQSATTYIESLVTSIKPKTVKFEEGLLSP